MKVPGRPEGAPARRPNTNPDWLTSFPGGSWSLPPSDTASRSAEPAEAGPGGGQRTRKEGERMHRTFQKPWVLLGGLVALLLVGPPRPATAQLCTPEHRPLLVLLNGTTRLQMASRKPIRTVVNPKEGI